jgi:Protein of unknown function (DUF3017)
MASKPAKAGSGRGLAPGTPPLGPAMPPAVRAEATSPRAPSRRVSGPAALSSQAPSLAAPSRAARSHAAPSPAAPSPAAPSSAARSPQIPRAARSHRAVREPPQPSGLAWIPYLIVLAGVAAGMYVAWQGSRYAGRGAGLVGGSMLAAALARLVLPPRYTGLLSSRLKASDVLAFTVFGAGVLALALMLL